MKGSSNERARAQIRSYLGFHPVTVVDAEQLQCYLLEYVVPQDQEVRHLRSAALDWCREHKIEPPSNDRIARILKSAVHSFETAFFTAIQERISPAVRHQLDQLLICQSACKIYQVAASIFSSINLYLIALNIIIILCLEAIRSESGKYWMLIDNTDYPLSSSPPIEEQKLGLLMLLTRHGARISSMAVRSVECERLLRLHRMPAPTSASV